MSVLIKGMDKPKNCFNCDFNMYDCYCKLNHGGIDRDFWGCETVCPISEVPASHGDLIDRDALRPKTLEEETYLFNCNALAVINNAPTVIEAEGRNEKI